MATVFYVWLICTSFLQMLAHSIHYAMLFVSDWHGEKSPKLTGNKAIVMLFGSLGIGFVWGWLLGLVIDRRPRPFPRTAYGTIILPLLLATGGFMSSIYALTNLTQVIYFTAATAVAGLLHHAILQGLRERYGQ